MKDLQDNQAVHAAIVTGNPLPTSRPTDGNGNSFATNPDGSPADAQAQENAQIQSVANSQFGYSHAQYMKDDPHYKDFTDNLTNLAFSLKKQVESGYIPLAIAQDKISQFVNDHREGFKKGNGDKFLGGQLAHGVMQAQMQQQAQAAAQQGSDEAQMVAPVAQQDAANQGGTV